MKRFSSISARMAIFLLWCTTLVAFFWPSVGHFLRESVLTENSAQMTLLPLCIIYLLWSGRNRIFYSLTYTFKAPAVLAAVSLGLALLTHFLRIALDSQTWLVLIMLSLLLLVTAGFWALFGDTAMKKAAFPFSLLILMVPIPVAITNETVSFLQSESTKLTEAFFSLLGVPVYRDGFLLTVPGVTIEVAKECSGINSSIALLITMLVVGCETLRTTWRRVALLVFVIPLSILKNAIRITTLTLLALHVNRGFLTGRLHHQGGFVFYLIALAAMYPVWNLLKRGDDIERSHGDPAPLLANKIYEQRSSTAKSARG